MIQYENQELMFIDGVGQYDFPQIAAISEIPTRDFIEFDYALRHKEQRNKTGIHFFEYDYKFARLWKNPTKYLNLLKQFACVVSPDFSEYTDFPKALQIYNHYRNCWLARYWQENGITIIPNISWSTPDNWDWQFEAYPKNGVVAVSNIGCMKHKDSKQLFKAGYSEMISRLEPKQVLLFSNSFDKEEYGENVIFIPQTWKKGA